jgi:hypothetical protein
MAPGKLPGLGYTPSGKVNRPPQIPAGMAVTAEIKTGKRRAIEYFLSPLLQYGNESLRER